MFYLLASALPSDQDVVENWNIKVSNQDGINSYSPPDPQTQIRVLSVDSFDVVAPDEVLDYDKLAQGSLKDFWSERSAGSFLKK